MVAMTDHLKRHISSNDTPQKESCKKVKTNKIYVVSVVTHDHDVNLATFSFSKRREAFHFLLTEAHRLHRETNGFIEPKMT
jgi:hypothetical protein